jgi:hypothetical protein
MSTNLFTRSLLRGYSDPLTDAGIAPPWANDELANAAFDKIASDLKLPEFLSEALSPATSLEVGRRVLAAQKLAAEQHRPAASVIVFAKQASAKSIEERGAAMASYYMAKAAEEASLNGVGQNTPESATQNSALARLDQKNRGTMAYMVGRGQTDLPEAGVLGKQHPVAPPGSPPIRNTLTNLDKQAAADAAYGLRILKAAHAQKLDVTSPKVVLAAACLAETRNPAYIRAFATKTANEMDGMMGDTLGAYDAQGAMPDPHLVQLLEHILQTGQIPPEVAAALQASEGADAGLGGGAAPPAGPAAPAAAAPTPAPPSSGGESSGPPSESKSESKDDDKKDDDGKKEAAFRDIEKTFRKGTEKVMTAAKNHPALAAGAAAAAGAAGTAAAMHGSDKQASILDAIKEAADGSLNAVGENTPEDAAKHNANAKLDQENRKTEAYQAERGETKLPVKSQARTEVEKKSAFADLVKKTAEHWGPKLPATMPQAEKRAHVVALAGMPEEFREQYVQSLSNQ